MVAAIVPWNFPLDLACWKLGPALAAGNSVILKPSENSPFSALRLGELALEAGVPTKTHVLNLLHRLIDGKASQVAAIDAPQALVLRQEPKANVARYDTLRGKDVRHAS